MQFALPQVDTKTLAEQGVRMVVTRVDTGEPLVTELGVMALILLGSDSKAYRARTRAVGRRQAEKARAAKPVNAQDFVAEVSDVDEQTIEILAAATVGWENVPDAQGAPIPFSTEAVADLYRQYPAIRDQADLFIGNRVNFLRASSTN
jgi:hypothetical protein